MKRSWLAAWMLMFLGQAAWAAEPASPLPFPGAQLPQAAQNADEAPKWNGGAAAAASATTSTQPSPISANTAASTSNASPTASETPPAASDAGNQPRPLKSVMKNRAAQAPSGSAAPSTAVGPSTAPAPTPANAAIDGLPSVMIAPPNTSVPATMSSVVPATSIVPAPVGLSQAPISAAAPPPSIATSPTQTPTPTPAAASSAPSESRSPSGVVPAQYVEPVQTVGAREQFPAQLMPVPRGTAEGTTIAPNSTSANSTAGAAAAPVAEPPVDAATQAAQQAAARAAADLLAGSLVASENQGSLSLADVLARCPEADRLTAIRSYWRLSRATSNYRWCLDEQRRLDQIVPNRSAVDGPVLSTVRAATAARVTDGEIEITAATAALGRAAPTLNVNGLFPADRPLVSPYHTYYSQLFANRPVGRTWEIDRALPVRLKSINDRAAAVQSAVSAVHYAEQAHAAGEADLRTVLHCHEMLQAQRRAFLDAVLAYNNDIAEYAMTAAPAGTPPEKVASMLIPTKPAERISAVPGKAPTTFSGGNTSSGPTRNDGWVSSTLKSLEPGEPSSRTQNNPSQQPGQPRSNQPLKELEPKDYQQSTSSQLNQTETQPRDPFSSPSGNNRYGNFGR